MSSIGYLGRGGGTPFRWELAPGCSVAEDRSAGAWLEESLTPCTSGLRLLHLIPPGYERYVRILYPAMDREGRLVAWRAVAELTGRIIHPEVQWEPLLKGPRGVAPAGLVSPWDSHMEEYVSEVLKRTVFEESTPPSCWMAVWSGHGGLDESFDAPKITIGMREYMLFRTPPSAVNDLLRPHGGPLPGIWWPDDKSFCVGTDTDVCWCYVGGPEALIERILAEPALEALEVALDHRGDYTSDTVNGPVRRW